MELHKLKILIGQIGSGYHCGTVTSASVGRSAREVSSTVSTGGQNGVLGPETVQAAILQTQSDHTPTLAIFHQQIQGEVLDKVVAVVAQGFTVEGVQERVTSSVGHATAPVSLTTFAKFERLTSESSLVDFS